MPERSTRRIPIPANLLPVLTAASETLAPELNDDRGRQNLFRYDSWQDEAWAFWRTGGEFNFGVTWQANTISRMRLVAAEQGAPGDEPAPLPPDHEASELVAMIGGSVTGQAAYLKSLTTHTAVPGESWTVIEQRKNGQMEWTVHSARSIREPKRKGAPFQVRVSETRWEPLPEDSLTFRVWTPDEEFRWKAFSYSEPALPILRTIDLYNRRIIATLVSRVAMNGFLVIPSEMTWQARKEFKDAPDPFVAELIDHASYAIKNPGTASAALPFPVKLPYQYADGFKHIAIENGVDDKLIQARDSEIRRLATTLHMPAEVLLGMGSTSHWNAWQISDEGIKTFLSPPMEMFVDALTSRYLIPALESLNKPLVGPNGRPIVVWYDPSEITTKPDKTQAAFDAYDRGEINGKTLRQEIGFEETSKPSKTELKDWTLKTLVKAGGQQTAAAVKELTGLDLGPAEQPALPGMEPGGDALAGREPTADETRTAPTMAQDRDKQPVTAAGWPQLNINGNRIHASAR